MYDYISLPHILPRMEVKKTHNDDMALNITRDAMDQLSILRLQHALAEQIIGYAPNLWQPFVQSIHILQNALVVDHPAYYETQNFLRMLSELPSRNNDAFKRDCAAKLMHIKDKNLIEFLHKIMHTE